MVKNYSSNQLLKLVTQKLNNRFGVVDIKTVSTKLCYEAVVLVINDVMYERRQKFWASNLSAQKKQVHYLSMEFLIGRNLKNSLFNLGINKKMEEALSNLNITLEMLYESEPDAGLGNGGLGRLAACYLDGLATNDYLATGYCILYEMGMFKQEIVDGWQNELPDIWLPGGQVWLTQKPGREVEIKFGGYVEELWEDGELYVNHRDYTTVKAYPFDINISGYDTEGVSLLRVWQARTTQGMNMASFNEGNYAGAFEERAISEAISKVLYPNDNHMEGKLLRLRQQYFLCAASIVDICNRHMSVYETFDNFGEKNAIHINDTHPTLAIPELMRFLLDDCGYNWDYSWKIVKETFSYTNHTIMREAMEQWDEKLFKSLLPRIYSIITEINNRFRYELHEDKKLSESEIDELAIIGDGTIKMANLAIMGSHTVNGVSSLHSQILVDDVFNDFYVNYKDKFTNVTNGIASRRWLLQSNPSLTDIISEAIGDRYKKDLSQLTKLNRFLNDKSFLDKIAESKLANKILFANHIKKTTGEILNPESIFDVQVKRIHEYKRQQMNALEIIGTYQYLRENPNADFIPRTYIFGGKAAAGYFLAKQFIRLIWVVSEEIRKDPVISKKMKVIFLEEYNVTTSEILMPASEISQQISLAGTEASGTGNMKLMLNGAITLGTLDGANVEINQQVGDENTLIFGMKTAEVLALRKKGYNPKEIYDKEPWIKNAVDTLINGFGDDKFPEIHGMLLNSDYYMALVDLDEFYKTRRKSAELYSDFYTWQKMSLRNIAQSGFFAADRAVNEYAKRIWKL